MNKWILPSKAIDKDNVQYQWVAERTACEVCQGMNGTIYDSANNIPDRPHPNCKCHIEIIEKDPDEPITDPIENIRKERKQRQRISFETSEILGHTKSLIEEIDEYIRQVNIQKEQIEELGQIIKENPVEAEDRTQLFKIKESVDFKMYRAESLKKDVNKLEQDTIVLKGKIEKIELPDFTKIPVMVLLASLELLKRTFNILWSRFEDILANHTTKGTADILAQIHYKFTKEYDAINLYKVASSNLNYNQPYIKENGKMYNSISELNENKLEKDIQRYLHDNTNQKDCKVLKLRADSSLAKKIQNSKELEDFIKKNIAQLRNGKIIYEETITFAHGDLYDTLHGATFNNVRLQPNGDITMTARDFYNFEANRTSFRGKLGYKLQSEGSLENYFIVIEIRIPKSVWGNYKI